MAKQTETSLTFVGGPLNGKTRHPDSLVVELRRDEYLHRSHRDGPLHEYVVDWDMGRADYVGELDEGQRKAKKREQASAGDVGPAESEDLTHE